MKRRHQKMILSCVFMLYAFSMHAQDNTIDSLQKVLHFQKEDSNKVNILNSICQILIERQDTAGVFTLAQQSIALADDIDFQKGKAMALRSLAGIYALRFNYPETRKYLLAALEIHKIQNDKKEIANLGIALATLYGVEENYPEALKLFYANLNLYDNLINKAQIAATWNDIGTIYFLQENLTDALVAYQHSLTLLEGTEQKSLLAKTRCWIANVYFKKGDYKKTLLENSVALNLYEEIGEKWGIANVYSIEGNVYQKEAESAMQTGDQVLAGELFSKSLNRYLAVLKIYETLKDEDGIAEAYLFIGNVHSKLNETRQARNYYQKCLQKAVLIGKKQYLRDAYLGISLIDSIEGKFRDAYNSYRTYIIYRDSLNSEESARKSERYRMQYEFGKKEDQIKLLSSENKLKTTLAEKENQRKKFAYVGIGLLVIAGGYGFHRYRRRKKSQSEQAVVKERFRISRELHDEIGATLSGISMYSHLAKEQIKTNQTLEIEKSLSIMQQSSSEMVDKLNDIVWLINPEKESLQKLVERLEEYARDMAAVKNMQVKVTVPAKVAELSLPMDSRRNIYLFCKETINNAVKYSEGSLLELAVKEMDNKLEFSVSDNGKGFDAVMVKRGNGLENMQKRADAIGAKLTLQSKLNAGVMVSMQCKITP